MHHKDIKRIIRKQLKKKYPKWNRLKKKRKKEIVKMVLDEAVKEYDFNQEVTTPLDEFGNGRADSGCRYNEFRKDGLPY